MANPDTPVSLHPFSSAAIRHLLWSAVWFVAIGPLAGTATFIALTGVSNPRDAMFTLSALPIVIVGAYFAGAIPAGVTGIALGFLDLSRLRGIISTFVVGAAVTAIFLDVFVGGSTLRRGVFWPSDEIGWPGLLQNGLWGGSSAVLTASAANLRTAIDRLHSVILSASAWHVPTDRQ